MTPMRPLIGEETTVEYVTRFGAGPPFVGAGIAFYRAVDEIFPEFAHADCDSLDSATVPAGESKQVVHYQFFKPGRHAFSFKGSRACTDEPRFGISGTFDVIDTLPSGGVRWTGSDSVRWGRRYADIAVLPRAGATNAADFHVVLANATRRAYGWKISYGDGTTTVGGSACDGGTETRTERVFRHVYQRPGRYRVVVDMSPACLNAEQSLKKAVIDEVLDVPVS